MTYQEILFFIGKTLTVNHIQENKQSVENHLKNNSINWDSIVKVSTANFVFPAMYCNLKKAELLDYLPEDLVGYMEHITILNRERNLKIIKQAEEINNLLKENSITPIFLKGTCNLLNNLYDDIGERMVGDIDFIVAPNEYDKTILILKEFSYRPIEVELPVFFRHYPRMVKKGSIAAIEVHTKLLREGFSNLFNYEHIRDSLMEVNGYKLLHHDKQFKYNILVHQINDYGLKYNFLSLRKVYDIFLIYKRDNNIDNSLTESCHSFIAASNLLLNYSIPYVKSKKTDVFKKRYLHLLNLNSKKRNKLQKRKKNQINIMHKINIILRSFYKKEYLMWSIKKTKEAIFS